MTEQEIQKAFEGRWRIKQQALYEPPIILPEHVRALCLDFFQTGIALASSSVDCCSPTVQDALFEKWWNLYNKKRGHKKCLEKWKKLPIEARMACIAAAPAYVASTPDIQFRKDPLTYLNGECWNDEIIMINQNGNSQYIKQQHFAEVAERIAEYTKEPR